MGLFFFGPTLRDAPPNGSAILSAMPIPDYQSCMLPVLQCLADGAEHTLRDTEETLARHFQLTPAERAALLPSGQQGNFRNRIGWARTYLKKAALLESPKRAVFKITERGRQTLAANPSKIDVKYLEQFDEFIEFRDASKPDAGTSAALAAPASTITPEEIIELAHQGLREQLAARTDRADHGVLARRHRRDQAHRLGLF